MLRAPGAAGAPAAALPRGRCGSRSRCRPRHCPARPCPPMPGTPDLLFKGGSAQDEPLSTWVGIWEAPVPSPPFPALTMSVCCCLFFRDYGSSKRKSGRTPGLLRSAWLRRGPSPPTPFKPSLYPPLNHPFFLCCMKLCSSFNFVLLKPVRDRHWFLSFALERRGNPPYAVLQLK